MTNRRQFIQATLGSTALVSLSMGVPEVLLGASAKAIENRDEKILIVIQLSGGNDGLNTVVPYGNDEYYKNRFTLAIAREQVQKINDQVGFHPSLSGFSELLEQNQLSLIQGVGYPNPNRSHFESMDLWHTAHRFQESSQLGWLGRCLGESIQGELPAVHYGGGKQPLALATRKQPAVTIRSLDQFRLDMGERNERLTRGIVSDMRQDRPVDNPLLGFVHESASVALSTSQRMESILDDDATKKFPATRLGKKLAAVSRLIDSGLPTRIYYVTHEGFDTHSNQAAAHAALLTELGDASQALMADLQEKGHSDRTLVMTFSEFGRRVRENASRGTDHGSAAPLFLFGGRVRSGPLNQHPSLTDLDQGDLKFSTDYRSVYATVLEEWLGVESQPVLGQQFEKLDLFV